MVNDDLKRVVNAGVLRGGREAAETRFVRFRRGIADEPPVVAAKSNTQWGSPSPALGAAIGGSFHSARALSGLIAAVGFALLAFVWGWWAGWQLSLFSLAIAA